jgi:hypothetical protein
MFVLSRENNVNFIKSLGELHPNRLDENDAEQMGAVYNKIEKSNITWDPVPDQGSKVTWSYEDRNDGNDRILSTVFHYTSSMILAIIVVAVCTLPIHVFYLCIFIVFYLIICIFLLFVVCLDSD